MADDRNEFSHYFEDANFFDKTIEEIGSTYGFVIDRMIRGCQQFQEIAHRSLIKTVFINLTNDSTFN